MCVSAAAAATTSLVAQAIGTAAAVGGSIYQGYATEKADRANRRIAEKNLQLALEQREEIKRRGHIQESQHRAQVAALVGRQKAAYASSGVLVGAGSAADVVSQTMALGAEDALEIRRRTAHDAQALTLQAANYGTQASMYGAMGRSALISGGIGAGGSLLTGTSSLYKSFYDFKKSGVWGG